MKYWIQICVLLISLICNSQVVDRKVLYPFKPEVVSIIEQLLASDLGYIVNSNDQTIVINVDNHVITSLKVSVIPKKDFKWLLTDHKDTIYGVWIYKERPIVVFGDEASAMFIMTNETIAYPWLGPSEPFQKNDNIISTTLDLPVWLYHYENGNFTFESVDWHSFFKK